MSNGEVHFTALRRSILFQNLSDEQIRGLLPKFHEKNFVSGSIIFEDGSTEADGMYIISSGNVKIYKNIPDGDGKHQAIAVLSEGSFFGEMALLDEDARSAGAQALSDCQLLFLSKQSFYEMISENLLVAHHILTQIAKIMSRRLRETNNLFREVVSWSYRARKEVRDLKNNFLATISHELRTPIHSIQGFTTLMKEYPDTDEKTKQKFFEIIIEESQKLAKLINDMICLAEIEFGSIIVERQPANMKEIVEKAFHHFIDAAKEKEIDYQLILPDPLPGIVVDINRFSQSIEYLIDNAIKFTPVKGKICVKANVTESDLIVSVEDNGKGIPAKYLEKIFDKFYQVDQSTTREIGGAGIGLTLARQIINLHGGKITVYSKENEGSVFTIHLPKELVLYTPRK